MRVSPPVGSLNPQIQGFGGPSSPPKNARRHPHGPILPSQASQYRRPFSYVRIWVGLLRLRRWGDGIILRPDIAGTVAPLTESELDVLG